MVTFFDFLAPFLAPLPLIRARQNADKPPGAYAAYFIRRVAGSEHTEAGPVDADGFRNVRENVLYSAQIDIFAPDAFSRATALRARLGTETAVDSGLAVGISLIGRGNVDDLTDLIDDKQYEARAMFEVEFYAPSIIAEEVQFIDTVELTDETEPEGVIGNFVVKVAASV